jgi:hypothetical protein
MRRSWILAVSLAIPLLGTNGTCERDPHAVPGAVEGVWALTADSAMMEGCFAPLRCPVAIAEDLGGTFRLQLLAAGARADVYEVRDVFWLARIHGEDVPITGSGTYVDGLSEDRLQLELRVGDEPPQVFESGLVPSGPPGAREIDIEVSIHGGMYFDTVIDVRAVAFPEREPGTPCGPAGLVCDPATEVCVAMTPIGPAIVYSCEPVPAGCEGDRSCGCAGAALCEEPFGLCTETGENRLECECLQCQ